MNPTLQASTSRWKVWLGALGMVAAILPIPGSVRAEDAASTNPVVSIQEPATNTAPAAPAEAHESATAAPDRVGNRESRRSSRRSGDRRRDRGGDEARSSGETPAAGTGTEFVDFKLITERNIFNPNRGRFSSGQGDRAPARRPVQVDLMTLVGALSYTKGDYAFFDGSSAQFRKTLKCGDSVAGYTIQSIHPNAVRLAAGDKTLEMTVGAQFRREDEGEWQFVARSEATALSASSNPDNSSGSATSSGSTTPTTDASPATGGGGVADDILQRLMRKREQEK